MFLEHFKNGNILDYLLTQNNDFTDTNMISKMLLKVFENIHILHTEMNLAHLGLKLHNVMLDDHFRPKLSSFSQC